MTKWYDIVNKCRTALETDNRTQAFVLKRLFRPMAGQDIIIQVVADGETPLNQLETLQDIAVATTIKIECYVQNNDDTQQQINNICDAVLNIMDDLIQRQTFDIAQYQGTNIEYNADNSDTVIGTATLTYEII